MICRASTRTVKRRVVADDEVGGLGGAYSDEDFIILKDEDDDSSEGCSNTKKNRRRAPRGAAACRKDATAERLEEEAKVLEDEVVNCLEPQMNEWKERFYALVEENRKLEERIRQLQNELQKIV